MNANVSERFAKSFSMGTCGSPALVPRIELKSDFHMKDRIVRTTKPRLELSVQSPSCRVHRTIAFATAILLTFVTSARGAGIELYETGAPDLGTASAGRAAMAADASTAAANPAGMTLLDRSQLLGASGALLPSTNFDVAPETTTSGGGGGNAGVFFPIGGFFY